TITFFFSSRRRHTRFSRDWSSDVCSSDLAVARDGLCAVSARVDETDLRAVLLEQLDEGRGGLLESGQLCVEAAAGEQVERVGTDGRRMLVELVVGGVGELRGQRREERPVSGLAPVGDRRIGCPGALAYVRVACRRRRRRLVALERGRAGGRQ